MNLLLLPSDPTYLFFWFGPKYSNTTALVVRTLVAAGIMSNRTSRCTIWLKDLNRRGWWLRFVSLWCLGLVRQLANSFKRAFSAAAATTCPEMTSIIATINCFTFDAILVSGFYYWPRKDQGGSYQNQQTTRYFIGIYIFRNLRLRWIFMPVCRIWYLQSAT